jgi:hypothetical protein
MEHLALTSLAPNEGVDGAPDRAVNNDSSATTRAVHGGDDCSLGGRPLLALSRFVRFIVARVSDRRPLFPHVSFALETDIYDIQEIGDSIGDGAPLGRERAAIERGDWRYATLCTSLTIGLVLRARASRALPEYAAARDLICDKLVAYLAARLRQWRVDERPRWEEEFANEFGYSPLSLLFRTMITNDVDPVFDRVAVRWYKEYGASSPRYIAQTRREIC